MLNASTTSPSVLEEDGKKTLTFQVIKVIAGILLIFFLPLEYLISSSLSNIEKNTMIHIQNNRTSAGIDLFKSLYYIGNHVFLIVIFPTLYHFYDARKAVKITMVVTIAMYCYSFLALIYVEPRPFWYTSSIKGEICQSGFGNPVLEIMLVTVLFVYTSYELFKTRSLTEQVIAYSVCVVIITLYFTACLYLGENFLHQCIVTIAFSFIYLTSAFALDKYITDLSLKCCFGYNENRKNSIYAFLATMVLLLAIISTNNLITNKKGIDILWIKHALAHCNKSYKVSGDDSFYVSAWIFYMQGAVFGSMYTSKRLSRFWWMTPYWKRGVRAVIAIGFSYGLYSLFDLFTFSQDTSVYIFNFVLPLLVISFVVHGIMPVVFAKLHLALKLSPDVDEESELSSYYSNI